MKIRPLSDKEPVRRAAMPAAGRRRRRCTEANTNEILKEIGMAYYL